MSYNGIGLSTVRGSGTNGYIQRNLSAVRRIKEKHEMKTEEEQAEFDSRMEKRPNPELLEHDRKRRIEIKCMELQDLMEEQGYEEDEIQKKVASYRQMLSENQNRLPGKEDSTGRPIITETHQIAEMKEKENENLRAAFGIRKDYVKGSAFMSKLDVKGDDEQKAKYKLVRTPSRSPSPEDEKSKHKKSENQRRRKRSSSSDEYTSEKRHKHKKKESGRRERSSSEDHSKEKKRKHKKKENEGKHRKRSSSVSSEEIDEEKRERRAKRKKKEEKRRKKSSSVYSSDDQAEERKSKHKKREQERKRRRSPSEDEYSKSKRHEHRKESSHKKHKRRSSSR